MSINPLEMETEDTPHTEADELAMLKKRADMMGIPYSNNIGLETLKARIKAKQEGKEEPKEEAEVPKEEGKQKTKSLRQMLYDKHMKLVRLRITNLDPKKKDLPGEIFTVANEYLGTVRKYVPYGEVTENGYHVPFCIYSELKSRRFLNIRSVRDRQTGQYRIEQGWAPEFALEVLPQLTPEEIAELAAAQAASRGRE